MHLRYLIELGVKSRRHWAESPPIVSVGRVDAELHVAVLVLLQIIVSPVRCDLASQEEHRQPRLQRYLCCLAGVLVNRFKRTEWVSEAAHVECRCRSHLAELLPYLVGVRRVNDNQPGPPVPSCSVIDIAKPATNRASPAVWLCQQRIGIARTRPHSGVFKLRLVPTSQRYVLIFNHVRYRVKVNDLWPPVFRFGVSGHTNVPDLKPPPLVVQLDLRLPVSRLVSHPHAVLILTLLFALSRPLGLGSLRGFSVQLIVNQILNQKCVLFHRSLSL